MSFDDRKGRCYELAYLYVSRTEGAKLVHGWIGGPNARLNRLGTPAIGHAWAITPAGQIYDPVLDETFDPTIFAHCFAGTTVVTYTRAEAMLHALGHANFGPWNDAYDTDDDRQRRVFDAWLNTAEGRAANAVLGKGRTQ